MELPKTRGRRASDARTASGSVARTPRASSLRRGAACRCDDAADVLDHIGEGVVILDGALRVLDANPAFTAITGYELGDVKGRRPPFLKALRRSPGRYGAMKEALAGGERWEGEFWGQTADGTAQALRLSLAQISGRRGRHRRLRAREPGPRRRRLAAVLSDVTQRALHEERVAHQANFDGLTDLPNRRLFQDRLESAIAQAGRSETRIAILLLDLDGFKLVNDTHGHDFGDRLLREAAGRLGKCIRAGDTIARLGGDEFTIVMPELDDAEDAGNLAARLLGELSAPFVIEGHEAYVSASIGITIFPDDGIDSNALTKNADTAMYRAKAEGRANFQFFRRGLDVDVRETLALRNGLRKAHDAGAFSLERADRPREGDAFSLHYQPKMDLATGRMVGVEALLRWTDPQLGSVSPARFVPILEESAMVLDVGLWAIRRACRQHRAWAETGHPGVRIAVNLSARQLRETTFVGLFERTLAEAGVGPEAIEVEITESMLMTDHQRAAQTLRALRALGIRIAMDDFGTGYSSLSYLKKFPIDQIKIDRSFVADIASEADDAELIRTIITMGHALERHIVAEGVETEEQANILKEYGCQQIQGYLVSPPLPPAGLAAFLTNRETSRARARAPMPECASKQAFVPSARPASLS